MKPEYGTLPAPNVRFSNSWTLKLQALQRGLMANYHFNQGILPVQTQFYLITYYPMPRESIRYTYQFRFNRERIQLG